MKGSLENGKSLRRKKRKETRTRMPSVSGSGVSRGGDDQKMGGRKKSQGGALINTRRPRKSSSRK